MGPLGRRGPAQQLQRRLRRLRGREGRCGSGHIVAILETILVSAGNANTISSRGGDLESPLEKMEW
jgi:hypothetical protein